MLGNFVYSNPTKLYFGDNAISFLSDELKSPFVLDEREEGLLRAFGCPVGTHGGNGAESTTAPAARATRRARRLNARGAVC